MKNSLRSRYALGLLVAGIVLVGIVAFRLAMPTLRAPEPTSIASQQKPKPKAEVAASATDVLGSTAQHSITPTKPAPVAKQGSDKHDSFYYGSTPAVALDANPQVKSVVTAIKEKNHPERLSTLIAPKPFDAKAFAADPTSYLNTIEPGRVYQTAQPGPGVPRLRSSSPAYKQIAQGESTTLKVQAPPKAPVTFTALDLGQFDNELTSITVQANEKGFAEAKYTSTPGTVENVHILAGSPVASGQVRFTVYVQWPQGSAAAANTEQIVSAQAKQ